MGRRVNETTTKTSLLTTDKLLGHDGTAVFQITVANASGSLGGGGGGGGAVSSVFGQTGAVVRLFLVCAADGTRHEIVVRKFGTEYELAVDQTDTPA